MFESVLQIRFRRHNVVCAQISKPEMLNDKTTIILLFLIFVSLLFASWQLQISTEPTTCKNIRIPVKVPKSHRTQVRQRKSAYKYILLDS